MNSKITQDDILLYLYKETSPKRSREIEEFINRDRAAKLFYLESKDTMEKLDALKEGPNETSIRIVMEAISKSSRLEETH